MPAIATATFLTSVAFVAVMEALALIHARLQVSRALHSYYRGKCCHGSTGATVYRFYVNANDATDKMSAVFGNDQAHLILMPLMVFSTYV